MLAKYFKHSLAQSKCSANLSYIIIITEFTWHRKKTSSRTEFWVRNLGSSRLTDSQWPGESPCVQCLIVPKENLAALGGFLFSKVERKTLMGYWRKMRRLSLGVVLSVEA